MNWEEVLKEFTPDENEDFYAQIIALLDYMEKIPDKKKFADNVREQIDRIGEEQSRKNSREQQKNWDEAIEQMKNLSQSITNTEGLREIYLDILNNNSWKQVQEWEY